MTAIAHTLSDARTAHDRLGRPMTVSVFRSLSQVEALWRGMEAEPGCVGTPYQRFDWVAAFSDAVPGEKAAPGASDLRILVLRDAEGAPQALIPLRIALRRGVRVAGVIGDKHANFHMPLFASPSAASRPEEIEAALVRAGREAGIDVFALDHQPRFWNGIANPLAEKGQPCASDAYGLMLGPDVDATIRRAFDGEARKKLRSKERKLAEVVGPVAYRRADSAEEATAILDAFYVQKAARFAAMGIADPYADAAIRHGLSRAASPGAAGPAIEVHALVAERTGRVLSTFIGAVDRNRFSGMCNSFDADPSVSR